MSSILNTIVAEKRREVAERRERVPTAQLERSEYFSAPICSLSRQLKNRSLTGVIAEFKRRSPSKGWINRSASVSEVTPGYIRAGAAALSVLTDTQFFGGSLEDLSTARRLNQAPILRKDFIIDDYQLAEARAFGADAVLLIAAILSPSEIGALSTTAHALGLEVVLEVHSAQELERSLHEQVDIVGVNNRNLADFSVSLDISRALIDKIPAHLTTISESGIDSPETMAQLSDLGYHGFLIGEAFMRDPAPESACARCIAAYQRVRSSMQQPCAS